jgi:Sec-independent protein translocase protein TatA
MGSLSVGHWLIVLAIVLLIFRDALREGADKKEP